MFYGFTGFLAAIIGLCTIFAHMHYESLNSDYVTYKKHKSNHFFEKFYLYVSILLIIYSLIAVSLSVFRFHER